MHQVESKYDRERVFMDDLNRFYHKWLITGIAIVMLAVILLVKSLVPLLPQYLWRIPLQDAITEKVLSIGFLSALFYGVELFIRMLMWKFVYPSLNLEGEWIGETFYTELEQPTAKITLKDFVQFSREHDVYIQQDCLHISIKPSKGASFTNWGSIVATIDKDANMKFLYWVNYSDNSLFPGSANGYEQLSPTMFEDKPRKGIPILLTGYFGHCAGSEKPIYSGRTIFVRRGFEPKIRISDLPDYARNGVISKKILREEK
jgi:hypothetical protein